MRNSHHSSIFKSLCLLGILLATAQFAPAQALVSAERGGEIAPFAQATLVSPDWGPTRNLGYTFGIDYTHFIRSIVQPSLEFRMTDANGLTVGERTYSGGLKLQTTVHRIHPYATLLAGYGVITFTHPVIANYLSDNSTIYSIGGGADFNVTSQWKLRVDFTHQNWNTGDNPLTPTALGVGIAYILPFHNGQVR